MDIVILYRAILISNVIPVMFHIQIPISLPVSILGPVLDFNADPALDFNPDPALDFNPDPALDLSLDSALHFNPDPALAYYHDHALDPNFLTRQL
ncbi:hypothetical protein EVAR_72068_1 [Eumeta japonica]|uniref:Uncharacterized protein n=1 Tax=Eumeta variegata TaxID=151549 RepID=A0A4C2AAE0_EUMVA|nr:hypothetical protein EVAR_72068_1 [Eumeta japonica]